MLILPADLPLITPDDVRNILTLGSDMFTVVLATDQNRDGTNALFIRPSGLIEYAFGPNSFQRHVRSAREAGVEPKVYHSDRLALDIDLPADLNSYNHVVRGLDYEALDLFAPD